MEYNKLSNLEHWMKKMAILCMETFAKEEDMPSLATDADVRNIVTEYNND